MTVKLIALDLDGTTLNSDKVISEKTRKALAEADARGVSIVVATGRPISALPSDVFEIDAVRYVLTSNGAAITDLETKNTFYRNCLSPLAVESSVKLLENTEYILEGFLDGEAYIEKSYYEYVQRTGRSFRDVKYILETRKPVENLCGFMLDNKDNIENINVNFENLSVKPALKELLLTIPEATITSSFKNNLEVGGATTSKAQALREMGKILGIKQQEMMAVGDSPNDIAMLKAAGLAVAMGNGEEEVKAIADYVSADNNHDGVAEAIEKFVLI